MKTVAFCHQNHIQCKLAAGSHSIRQISNISYAACNVSYWYADDINITNSVPDSTVEPSIEHLN